MPRSARIVIPDVPHHITQRGNHQEDIFLDDSDRETYIEIIRRQSVRHRLIIHGWCLMSNHIHLIATPPKEDSLARTIGQAHHLYSKAFNRKHGQTGHVWHSRYYSCALDSAHLVNAMIYVDRNPVRAGLVAMPRDWRWSSAAAHIDSTDPWDLIDMDWWKRFSDRAGWMDFIAREQAEQDVELLRRHTRSGRPLGDGKFVAWIERKLGYPVALNPRGRPRNKS